MTSNLTISLHELQNLLTPTLSSKGGEGRMHAVSTEKTMCVDPSLLLLRRRRCPKGG